MTRLHVELIDEILTLAVALGTIRANEASRICTRWRSFQRIVFRSITLDPFDTDILDLTLAKHSHLTSYIEELRVVPRSVSYDMSHDYEQDLSPSFTNFLCNIKSPRVMIFYDTRIKWANLSLRSIDSFLAVFQCDSLRSLVVCVSKPLPSWMLPSASNLTIHCVGLITLSLLFTGPILEPCSLTHLVLLTNATIQLMGEFCVEEPDSAKALLRQLDHLELEYFETYTSFEPVIAPFIEDLLVVSGTQLKALDLRIQTCNALGDTPPVSASAFRHLDSLQHLSIRLTVCRTKNNALKFAGVYMPPFLDYLSVSSPITTLSLTIEGERLVGQGDTIYSHDYPNLLQTISQQLASDEWRYLASASILVNVQDRSRKLAQIDGAIRIGEGTLELKSLLRVNNTMIVAAVRRVK